MEGYTLHTIFRLVMERNQFSALLDAVRFAPITPMQALELMHYVYMYMQAVHDYNEAKDDAIEQSCIWRLRDHELEFNKLRRKLDCGLPSLTQFRNAIY